MDQVQPVLTLKALCNITYIFHCRKHTHNNKSRGEKIVLDFICTQWLSSE